MLKTLLSTELFDVSPRAMWGIQVGLRDRRAHKALPDALLPV